MSEPSSRPVSLDLTDDEFVKLHASASAEGLEVNDFIVATLRKHARIEADIVAQQQDFPSDVPPET
ncbi:MAG: hypothetical protein V4689_05310 [Verrucomicrobiota bacterium]